MSRGKYGQKDKATREHDQCIMAVHKVTGKMFGGKASGNHVGYTTKGALKSAMTLAGVKHEDYTYIEISFSKGDFSRPTPTLTVLEE